jgi:hypothetical protein
MRYSSKMLDLPSADLKIKFRPKCDSCKSTHLSSMSKRAQWLPQGTRLRLLFSLEAALIFKRSNPDPKCKNRSQWSLAIASQSQHWNCRTTVYANWTMSSWRLTCPSLVLPKRADPTQISKTLILLTIMHWCAWLIKSGPFLWTSS